MGAEYNLPFETEHAGQLLRKLGVGKWVAARNIVHASYSPLVLHGVNIGADMVVQEHVIANRVTIPDVTCFLR